MKRIFHMQEGEVAVVCCDACKPVLRKRLALESQVVALGEDYTARLNGMTVGSLREMLKSI
jgi:hypothetical protein